MQTVSLETGSWEDFWKEWGDTIRKIPGLKEKLLEQAGDEIRREVQQAIDHSGLQDGRLGRVKRWQNSHIGSGKGYVAVRSDSVMVQSGGGNRQPLNAGAITNYLESGHKVRGPSGRAERYVSRAVQSRVKSFRFYKAAQSGARKTALESAEALMQSLKEEIEG